MKKRNSGITLVALVITIIVLIILSGVSINAVMNQGLITNAKDAREQYEKSKTKEEINIGKLVQEVENSQGSWVQEGLIITNKNDSTVELNVGEYVAYTPQSEVTTYEVSKEYSGDRVSKTFKKEDDEHALIWRVLGVNEHGRLELISANTTSDSIALKGHQGYNNGVYLINDICNKLYGNPDNGTSARGVNIEDIQKVMDSEVWNYSDYGEYDTEWEITDVKVPTILALEKGQAVNGVEGNRYSRSEQDELIIQTTEEFEEKKNITVTHNYWQANLTENNFEDEIYYDLFINNGESYLYHIASRLGDYFGSDDEISWAYLGIWVVSVNYVSSTAGYELVGDEAMKQSAFLRPIVTLGSRLTVDTDDNTKDGLTPEKAWELK